MSKATILNSEAIFEEVTKMHKEGRPTGEILAYMKEHGLNKVEFNDGTAYVVAEEGVRISFEDDTSLAGLQDKIRAIMEEHEASKGNIEDLRAKLEAAGFTVKHLEEEEDGFVDAKVSFGPAPTLH